MNCYVCGAKLTNNRFCPNCLTDVRIWARTSCISNRLYNEGLRRAEDNNLMSAAGFLELSLKYNKANIDARNLLGLVYYRTGEVIDALSEWVISLNLKPENNIAAEYVEYINDNPAYLDEINQAVKKYNQAIAYCDTGDYDLAAIQLKGAVSQNPNMVKAYLLLALLAIRDNNIEEAREHIRSARAIDSGNKLADKYAAVCRKQARSGGEKPQVKENEAVEYKRENEFIIQPKHMKDNTALVTVINILLGVAIGVTITLFLLVPQIRQTSATSANKRLTEANENLASRDKTIEELEAEVEELEAKVTESESTTSEYKTSSEELTTKIEMYEKLIEAYIGLEDYYYDVALQKLEEIDRDALSDAGKEIYDRTYNEASSH